LLGRLKIHCNACGHGFDVAPSALDAACPSCGARIALTSMETRPRPTEAAKVDPAILVGQILGGYRLRSILGGGGMGTVYEAERADPSIAGPEIAAVKVLSPAFTGEPAFVERFRREADALTQLRHPNLIEVYARGEHAIDDRTYYYFVMERFFGEDLRSLMGRGKVMPATAAAIVRLAAEGLAYAHRSGIVHRDVKPANILVRGDPAAGGAVKVVDFGVAQLATSNYTLTSLTSSSLVLGTINYMSPEQRIDASEIDHRADIYALGVVAYELLTGRLPIGAFEPPSELAGTSRAADRAVLEALRRDPIQRPESILTFAERLESALARRGPRLGWSAAAAAAIAIAVGIGFGVTREPSATEAPIATKDAPPEQPAQIDAPPPEPPAAILSLIERMKADGDYALARSEAVPAEKGGAYEDRARKLELEKAEMKKLEKKKKRPKSRPRPSTAPLKSSSKPTDAKLDFIPQQGTSLD
jgi:serine/threonine protein kinase